VKGGGTRKTHVRFQSPWQNLCSNQHTTQSDSLTAYFRRTETTQAMAHPPKATFPLSLLSLVLATTTQQEEFSEELLLKPLPDRKILAHFHFQNEAPFVANSFARHHHLFPKSISQLVRAISFLFFLFVIFVNENIQMAFNCLHASISVDLDVRDVVKFKHFLSQMDLLRFESSSTVMVCDFSIVRHEKKTATLSSSFNNQFVIDYLEKIILLILT